jgi:arylesterase/paraoxonase
VEVMDFDYESARAIYVTSITDDRSILSPIAVAPTSYTTFYVTNDHYLIKRRHPIMSFTEAALQLPLGWVTFVDIAARETPVCTVAAGGIPFAHGIVITPTGKELLVASTSTNCVRIYQRDPETNVLSSRYEKIKLTFHPDNLSFDSSLSVDDPTVFDENEKFLRGVIVAGCPDAGRLFCMATSPEGCKAPSIVTELRRGNRKDPAPYPAVLFCRNNKYTARTLYESKLPFSFDRSSNTDFSQWVLVGDGDHYPSSTTGDMDSKRGRLIVAGLYAQGLLDITWDPKENLNK